MNLAASGAEKSLWVKSQTMKKAPNSKYGHGNIIVIAEA